MNKLLLSLAVALLGPSAFSQTQPVVEFENLTIVHESRGWRVTEAPSVDTQFNLAKGDRIIRIDDKNASEAGPMVMTSLFNQHYRRAVHMFLEHDGQLVETNLRKFRGEDLEPAGANPFRRVASGFSAPDLDIEDIDGHPLTLSQFNGKWLLIDFMASWCPPCKDALPKTLDIVRKNQISLVVAAINDRKDSVLQLRRTYKVDAPIVMTGIMSRLPIDFGVSTSSWTGEVPGYVLIRPDGSVALIKLGSDGQNRFADTVEKIMKNSANDVAP